jgi:hypothetical protein
MLNALVILACAGISPSTPVPVIVGLLFVSGLTRSMQFTTISTIAFADVPAERMNGANTLSNIAQPLGLALGIATAALALRGAALLFPAGHAALTLTQFHVAFLIIGAIALVGVTDTIGLAPEAGDILRTRPAGAPPLRSKG